MFFHSSFKTFRTFRINRSTRPGRQPRFQPGPRPHPAAALPRVPLVFPAPALTLALALVLALAALIPVAAAAAPSGRAFTNDLGMDFVWIEPGTYLRGSPGSESGRDNDERQHRVTLTRGFFMQTTEVTVGQWRNFVLDTGYRTEAETGGGAWVWTTDKWEKKAGTYWDNPGFSQAENHPVTCVSWNDVQKFIAWLNKKENRGYRLPTEAEWEYAARAGTTTRFSFGDDENRLDQYAWYGRKGGDGTKPVAKKQPNAWGLYDMHGNVWEWCSDWFGDYPSGSVTDPTGPSSGSIRVARGGGWGHNARYCRSANRDWAPPDARSLSLGFRLVCPQAGR